MSLSSLSLCKIEERGFNNYAATQNSARTVVVHVGQVLPPGQSCVPDLSAPTVRVDLVDSATELSVLKPLQAFLRLPLPSSNLVFFFERVLIAVARYYLRCDGTYRTNAGRLMPRPHRAEVKRYVRLPCPQSTFACGC